MPGSEVMGCCLVATTTSDSLRIAQVAYALASISWTLCLKDKQASGIYSVNHSVTICSVAEVRRRLNHRVEVVARSRANEVEGGEDVGALRTVEMSSDSLRRGDDPRKMRATHSLKSKAGRCVPYLVSYEAGLGSHEACCAGSGGRA